MAIESTQVAKGLGEVLNGRRDACRKDVWRNKWSIYHLIKKNHLKKQTNNIWLVQTMNWLLGRKYCLNIVNCDATIRKKFRPVFFWYKILFLNMRGKVVRSSSAWPIVKFFLQIGSNLFISHQLLNAKKPHRVIVW